MSSKLAKLLGLPRRRSKEEVEANRFAEDIFVPEVQLGYINFRECPACARNRNLNAALIKVLREHQAIMDGGWS